MNSSRRRLLQSASVACALGTSSTFFAPKTIANENVQPTSDAIKKIRYCLNMSTIQGEKVPIQDQIKIAQKAGYDAVELWLRDIDRYLERGGNLVDLRKQIADAGLTVESAIAFGQWIVNDDAARAKGLEQAARDMDKVRRLGGHRIAAPLQEPPTEKSSTWIAWRNATEPCSNWAIAMTVLRNSRFGGSPRTCPICEKCCT